jgi:flagellar biosynthesis/type III secretory pathway M-ring protein FliF/YscJ
MTGSTFMGWLNRDKEWWANLAAWLIAFVVIVIAARLVLHP